MNRECGAEFTTIDDRFYKNYNLKTHRANGFSTVKKPVYQLRDGDKNETEITIEKKREHFVLLKLLHIGDDKVMLHHGKPHFQFYEF